MREVVTDLLDLLGLLLLATAASAAAWRLIGPPGVAAGGVVVLAGARLIDWLGRPGRQGGTR